MKNTVQMNKPAASTFKEKDQEKNNNPNLPTKRGRKGASGGDPPPKMYKL